MIFIVNKTITIFCCFGLPRIYLTVNSVSEQIVHSEAQKGNASGFIFRPIGIFDIFDTH